MGAHTELLRRLLALPGQGIFGRGGQVCAPRRQPMAGFCRPPGNPLLNSPIFGITCVMAAMTSKVPGEI